MQHPFTALEPEYNSLLANMRVTRQAAVDATAAKLMGFVREGRYKAVSDELGIPQIFIATSFEREASSNFRLSPAQGDPIDRVSTHVPRGRGPYPDWHAAAIDAYTIDHLDKVGKDNWTWARLCYEGETFNGFGYRSHGVHSPYDWAGTNDYQGGKYIADGVFSATAVDSQLGIVPVARAMATLDPSLDIPGWPGGVLPPVTAPAVVPAGVGGDQDVVVLQTDLNKLGYGPLIVDGNYGRRTRVAVAAFQKDHSLDVDGLSGPTTFAAIQAALQSQEPIVPPGLPATDQTLIARFRAFIIEGSGIPPEIEAFKASVLADLDALKAKVAAFSIDKPTPPPAAPQPAQAAKDLTDFATQGGHPMATTPTNVTVPIGSSLSSKINVTAALQLIATLLTVFTGGKINLTADQQAWIVGIINTLGPIAIMLFRTFGTTMITPQSAARLPAASFRQQP